ncbi:hypothetical protein FKM82_004373 [Ascaphus truei]
MLFRGIPWHFTVYVWLWCHAEQYLPAVLCAEQCDLRRAGYIPLLMLEDRKHPEQSIL